MLLCCNPTIIIIYCYAHACKKGWLTNMLSLSIILNLVSELFAIRILLLLSFFAAGLLSPSPKWSLLLLPPTPLTKMAVQPNQLATQELLSLVPSPTSNNPNLQSRTMTLSFMFLSSLFT